MNWKVVLLLCLVFFAATIVTSLSTTMISLTSLQKIITTGTGVILNIGLGIEPAGGDPVDNVFGPS